MVLAIYQALLSFDNVKLVIQVPSMKYLPTITDDHGRIQVKKSNVYSTPYGTVVHDTMKPRISECLWQYLSRWCPFGKAAQGGLNQDFFWARRRRTEVRPISSLRAISDLLIPCRHNFRTSAAL